MNNKDIKDIKNVLNKMYECLYFISMYSNQKEVEFRKDKRMRDMEVGEWIKKLDKERDLIKILEEKLKLPEGSLSKRNYFLEDINELMEAIKNEK